MKSVVSCFLLFSQLAVANPLGESLISGDALIVPGEVHQFSERAIIEWQDFSIGSQERMQFFQPSRDSVILNQVIGPNSSKIYGTLDANGQVILVNPNGVIVGKTGVINAASFFASTSSLRYDDFMKGDIHFSVQDVASMIHVEGRIEASACKKVNGRIFLIAGEVLIGGKLTAESGQIEVFGNDIVLEKGGHIDVSGGDMGHAGKAKIRAEQRIDFLGAMHAKGGTALGNGGQIEVSSRGSFHLGGEMSTMASNGQVGMFLIDSTDVMIRGISSLDGEVGESSVLYTSGEGGLVSLLNQSSVTISTAMEQGHSGHLMIDSTADFSGWIAPHGLTLLVAGDLNILQGAVIGMQSSGVGGEIAAKAGGNIVVGADLITNGGNISLLAGPQSGISGHSPTGSLFLNSVLDTIQVTGGQKEGQLMLRGCDITSSATLPHQTSRGTIDVFAERDIHVGGSSKNFVSSTGTITLHANRHINLFPGGGIISSGDVEGLQIDIQADYNRSGEGDLRLQAALGIPSSIQTSGGDVFMGGHNVTLSGAMPALDVQGTVLVKGTNVEIQARNNVWTVGGTGIGSSTVSVLATGDLSIRAGNDITVQGGTGVTGASILNAGTGANGLILLAGNMLSILGGTGTQAAALVSADKVYCAAHKDVIIKAGPARANRASITALASTPSVRAGRHLLFYKGSVNGVGGVVDEGFGCDLRAGGDIQNALSFSQTTAGFPIYIEADAAAILHPAQTGPYLVGTPLASPFGTVSKQRGAYRVDTSPARHGVEFFAGDQEITLYSPRTFFDGTPADIVFDKATVANAQKISSTCGNIQIGAFRNTEVQDVISTEGAILIATDNDLRIHQPDGCILAGGPITVIVDEQAPTSNGGGGFHNWNDGLSTSDKEQRIAIYAASGPTSPNVFSFATQVHLGNMDFVRKWDADQAFGLLSKYGTSFQAGGKIHGAGFKKNYVAGLGVFSSPVIWYKSHPEFYPATRNTLYALQALGSEIPERLWIQKFWIHSNGLRKSGEKTSRLNIVSGIFPSCEWRGNFGTVFARDCFCRQLAASRERGDQ